MARNRNSHETRKKILEVSKDLFLEKGFDNTSIQDIIDGLGGMTKGVIYHHFESKYEILQSIIRENNQEISNYNWRGDTGLEKIQNSLMDSFSNFEHQRLVYSASIMLRSPRLLGEQYLGLFSDFLPEIRERVYEGVKDQSIKTEYPEELADLIVLTLNIWIGFQISVFSVEELKRKMNFIKLTFDGLGVQLISDEMMEVIFKLFDHLKRINK
ncbi:TetR/AcrR family transcriptional regulator [Gemella sanguinis]|jgi:transcriptional regulator, TetR family|uniref:TetR family transcriptional regulator n=1 Tax=Gemella sanguinis TaxID=84135 RepID=A0A2N6SGU5_9BACL|nr:TetR/AcrR family transcriptional regulator [Gemella sanguinis]PMC53155.1 TetR family transcriptional regulator [Gemella sanguinis]